MHVCTRVCVRARARALANSSCCERTRPPSHTCEPKSQHRQSPFFTLDNRMFYNKDIVSQLYFNKEF